MPGQHRTTQAVWILALTLVLILSQHPSVSAHFTLGRLTGTSRFHEQDFDPHVPGPTAFLWPGAGYAAITGNPSGLPPGYQTPWPNGNPPSAPSSWYQLEGNAYAPFGSILASTPDHPSIGDLILGINFTQPTQLLPPGADVFYSGIYIYVPPDFNQILSSQIVTSITNDYAQIGVSIAPSTDPFAPGWTRVSISSSSLGFIMAFRASHSYNEWYYIRLNGVVAPEIAGKYFFKILLRMSGNLAYSYPSSSNQPTATNLYMPVQNWPVVLVKGEVDPALLYGTIRYGTWNETLYRQPIPTSGMVRAIGQAINPYNHAVTTRPVEARGFFNESARGHYEVEGLAPGIYDIYASAAGFPEQQIAAGVVILRGQSMKLDGYLNPGPVISGQVFSRAQEGEAPWSGLKPIRIEIYATNEYTAGNLVSYSPSNMTGARWGLFNAGNVSGVSYSWTPGLDPLPTRVALSWESAPSYYSDGTMFVASGATCGGSPDPCGIPDGVGPAGFWWVDPSGALTNGGGSSSFLFRFGSKGVFGTPANMSGYVPQALATWISGLVPGRYFVRAYVNGYIQTTPDGQSFQEYYFEVSANEWAGDIYVPLDLYVTNTINVTIHLHDIPGTLAPSPITRPNSLVVELYDDNYNLVAMNFSVVPIGASAASVLLTGLGLHGSNLNRRFSLYAYRGFGYQDYGILPGVYHVKAYVEGYLQKDDQKVSVLMGFSLESISFSLYRGASFELTVYSLDWEHPPVQRNWRWPGERMSIQVYNSTGTLIDIQPFLIHFAQPDGAASIGPIIFDGNHGIVAQPRAEFLALLGTKPTAYSNGSYFFKVLTYGYIQPEFTDVFGVEGNATTDVRINLLIGVNVTLNIKFRSEGIFSAVPFNMSMRIRMFNDVGDLVGAWLTGSADDVLFNAQNEAGLTQDPANMAFVQSIDPVHRDPFLVWYVPAGANELKVTLAGIPTYFDPLFMNATTDGIKGAPFYHGSWTVEVDTVNWYQANSFSPPVSALLQGESYHIIQAEAYPFGWTGEILAPNHLGPYSQREKWIIPNTKIDSDSSNIHTLDLNGYIQGQILAMTWSDEARSASWVRIEAVNDRFSFATYSLDGFFDMYLIPGSYYLSVTEWASRSEGHKVVDSVQISISPGASVGSLTFILDESKIPLSEPRGLLGLLILMSLMVIYLKKTSATSTNSRSKSGG